VVILNVDTKERKIALGIKQLTKDPWRQAKQSMKPGKTTVTGKIKDIKNNSMLIELENDMEGFMKLSELENTSNGQPSSNLSVGDEITGLVTGFDNRKRQVNLSQKSLNKKLERESISDFISSQGESSVKLGDLLEQELKSIDN